MAQVIYTGQNAGTTLQGNQSLQAATQFAQNDMTRKRDELSTSLKERDTFLSNLKYDPIFVASTKANEKMAENLDKYTNKWSEINNKRKGKLSTKDFAEMQLDRSVMMAEADMYKEGNDRGARQLQEFQNNKGLYDPVEFEAAYNEWMDTGMVPKTGLLYPAYKDPAIVWQKDKSAVRDVVKDIRKDAEGNQIVKDIPVYDDMSDQKREDYAVNAFDVDPNIQYQYNLKYRDSSPELKKIADDYAMEKGYESGAKALAAIEGIKYLWREGTKDTTVKTPSVGSKGFVFNNGMIINNKTNAKVTPEDNLVSATIGTGKGLRFTNARMLPVPGSEVTFSYGDMNFTLAEGTNVNLKPSIVMGDKVEWNVDKNNRPIVQAVFASGQRPSGAKRVGSDPKGGGTIYSFQLPAEATGWSYIDRIKDTIDPAYDDLFTPLYDAYTKSLGSGSTTKTETKDWSKYKRQ